MAEDTQSHIEKWQRLLVIVSTLLVLTIFVGVVTRLMEFIHHTLLLFMLGGLLAYAFEPVVESLRHAPGRFFKNATASPVVLPRPAAITVVYITVLLVIGLGIYGLSRPLHKQIKALTDTSQSMSIADRAGIYLTGVDTRLDGMGIHVGLARYVKDPSTIPDSVKTGWVDFEHKALGFVGDFAVSIGESVIVLLLSLYLLIYAHEIRDKTNAQLPDNLKTHVVLWQEDVNRILGGFVRGQLILALVLGSAAAIGCLAIGIHIWLLIGIFVAFAALIPVFGPYLGAAPAIVAAVITPTHFSNPLVAVVLVAVLFVVINEVGSKIIYPRLVGQAIGLHEVLVLFAIFAGLEIDGIVGVLFAAPLTAILIVTMVHLYRLWQDLPDSLLSDRKTTKPAAADTLKLAPANGQSSGAIPAISSPPTKSEVPIA